MLGYLISHKKNECCGCEGCAQICPKNALSMVEDQEGFRYPSVDSSSCIQCGLCHEVCPYENAQKRSATPYLVFGGYHKDPIIREASTSGGAFSAIAHEWCDKNYAIFGVAAEGLKAYHQYITEKSELGLFRKSKYIQSEIGASYKQAKELLKAGKKVLFSGTPCQIAGLKAFLSEENQSLLLTVEVVCEGVPSPLFIQGYERFLEEKYGSKISNLDYRYKDGRKWDFQVMSTSLESGHHFKMDRWFNPFWSIWLSHLMSRPCCYDCPYATVGRVADISLGDLWGVHLYCPELYGSNGGSSLVVCNTEKGVQAFKQARQELFGHELNFEDALKYQSPMCKTIETNRNRDAFMKDLRVLSYPEICKKWAKPPTIRLLWSKYVWGNRQKVFFWNIKQKLLGGISHLR